MKLLSVKVKPRAKTAALSEQADGSWLAAVTAAPVDGQANAAVIALVAAHFGVRRSQVRIKSGASSRSKRIEVNAG
jgi:uncharacterized protein YggU (UPF0235/DUF167 family)